LCEDLVHPLAKIIAANVIVSVVVKVISDFEFKFIIKVVKVKAITMANQIQLSNGWKNIQIEKLEPSFCVGIPQ
jgi:predicted lysophospholipase L1 biosynthesis ABC-type transport system permease subunit